MKPSKNASKEFYINPKELKEEIRQYKKTDVISEKLGGFLIKLAKRYSSKPNFSQYTYREDFVADAVCRMCEQLHKIDLDMPNSNPFSYLTKICYWKFVAKINLEKKYQMTKIRLRDDAFDQFEESEGVIVKKNADER